MRYPEGCAAPGRCAVPVQHAGASEQAQENLSPEQKNVTSKSPVGDISVVTLIRTDTTLDHSQKAENVWRSIVSMLVVYMNVGYSTVQLVRALCPAASSELVANLT